MLREEIGAMFASALAALPALPLGKGAMILILGGVFVLGCSLIWILFTPTNNPRPEPERPKYQPRYAYARTRVRRDVGRRSRGRTARYDHRAPTARRRAPYVAPNHIAPPRNDDPWLEPIAPTPRPLAFVEHVPEWRLADLGDEVTPEHVRRASYMIEVQTEGT